MRFAVMSDIHANPVGLERAFEDAKRHNAEAFVCLGDYVGYGPDPEGAIQLSRKIFGEQAVMGNHDAALLHELSTDSFSGRARKSIDRQRSLISEESAKWLSRRPPLWLEEPMLGVHGDIRQDGDKMVAGFGYVFRPEDVERVLMIMDLIHSRVTFLGHTHEPMIWCRRDDGPVELLDVECAEIEPKDRFVVNVGTVGCPRSVPYASYAIVETRNSYPVAIELHKLDFDYVEYRDSLLAANADVPIWLEDVCRNSSIKMMQ